ncbi:hypothetical protein HJC23_002661 [Cyclotella cryptica]|uniref:Ferric oxidoreductase domain-containing protein n=1 Tax=Cyclotella cryptica TaxID=29204 RepID=A0ABD3PLL2_9STRA
MVFTEPIQTKKTTGFNDSVSIEPFPQAIEACDICILAIPDYAIELFLIQNFSLLKDSIMIDLTNGNRKNKRDLKRVLSSLDIKFDRWVKAFNDIGAIQELQHHSGGKSRFTTQVCGPDEESVEAVIRLAEALGYSTKKVPIDQYEKLQGAQDTIGWEWNHSIVLMVALFLLVSIYIIIQTSGRPNFEWYTILARHSNRMFAWTSIYGFALSLLPGTLIRLINAFGNTRRPRLLVWGCNIRKHVGLISLYFLFLHACMTVLLFGGEYFGYMLFSGEMAWEDEASMLTAVVSTSLFVITGIASLPSVGDAMNKAQFACVFGPVVWMALALGVMHVLFIGVTSWTATPRSPYAWARGMPPETLLSSVFPLFVMFLKAVQVGLGYIGWLKNKINASKRTSVHNKSSRPPEYNEVTPEKLENGVIQTA